MGVLLLRQDRAAEAVQAFESGLAAPDPGEGGCVSALNRLGRGLALRATGSQDGEDLDTALTKLGELGVEVLPHGLDRLVEEMR